MSIFNNTEENYWRNLATKTVLVCITVAIIVWFLPRNEGRMYRYDVGKPWMYGSVIAKFDFPIYKTDEAIKHEQDSLLKHFQPYYSLNPLIEKKQVERFLHDYEQASTVCPKNMWASWQDRCRKYTRWASSTPTNTTTSSRTPPA